MVYSLKNLDVSSLQVLLDRSLRVNSSLMFQISETQLLSSISNEDDNYWKEWSIPAEGLFEWDGKAPEQPIKILYVNGAFFRKNYLDNYSKQKVSMKITVNEMNEATQIEVIGETSFKTVLKTNIKTSNYRLAKDALNEDTHNKMFSIDSENKVTSFEVEPKVWAEVSKLIGLSVMSDNPLSYIEFIGKDGKIEISDNSFNFKLCDYSGSDFVAKFPKKSLSYLDNEPVTLYLNTDAVADIDWMIIESKHSSVKSLSACMLMKSLGLSEEMSQDGGSSDLFNDDSGWDL